MVSLTEYEKQKNVRINSNESGVEKTQELTIDGSVSEGQTGGGVIGYDTANVNDASDVAFFMSDGSTLRDYWIENPSDLGTNNPVYVHIYGDFVADDSVQVIMAYGDSSTDYQASYSQVFRETTIEAAYTFSESSGNEPDRTGNGRDLDNFNNLGSRTSSGITDGAYHFDGDSSQIAQDGTAGSLPDLNKITIISHIRPITNGSSSWNRFVSFDDRDLNSSGDGNNIGFRSDEDDSQRGFFVYANGQISLVDDTSGVISKNTDLVLSGVWDGDNGNAEYYENGNLNASTNSAPTNTFSSADTKITFGNRSDGDGSNASDHMDCYHSHTVVYSDNKSQSFIQAHVAATSVGGRNYFIQEAAESITTQVVATPALGQGTPVTAQTTSILGNWRGQDDGRITERTQTKVQGEYAQKWQLDADKTTAEKATFVADQTMQPDLSTALGTNAGSFTQGTFGLHMQIDNTTVLRDTDTLQLKVGSSPNDYAVWTLDRSELGPDGEFTYYTFSHSDYDSITGTPDWTSADFYELTLFEQSGNATDTFIYVDYLTVSDRDDVGATGIGDRRSDKEQIRSGD